MNIDLEEKVSKMKTRADVIALLKANEGKRFSSSTLSTKLKIPRASVRLMMTDIGLEIQTERLETGEMMYYYTSEPPLPKTAYKREFKPLKLDRATQDTLDRCRSERGGEFHPISVS